MTLNDLQLVGMCCCCSDVWCVVDTASSLSNLNIDGRPEVWSLVFPSLLVLFILLKIASPLNSKMSAKRRNVLQ